MIKSPATTKVSLFAKAIVFLAFIALIVGFNPEYPTKAVSTTSIFSPSTTSSNDCCPANTFMPSLKRASSTSLYFSSLAITTVLGLNLIACSISSLLLLFAVKTSTSNKFECSLITSNAWVPIEPVEPSIAICFFFSSIKIHLIYLLFSCHSPVLELCFVHLIFLLISYNL